MGQEGGGSHRVIQARFDLPHLAVTAAHQPRPHCSDALELFAARRRLGRRRAARPENKCSSLFMITDNSTKSL
jgi:hypothetical protein